MKQILLPLGALILAIVNYGTIFMVIFAFIGAILSFKQLKDLLK